MQVSVHSSTSAILVLPARLMPTMRMHCFRRAASCTGHFTACLLSKTFWCRALQHRLDARTALQESGIPERGYSRRSALNTSCGVEQPSGPATPSTGGTKSGHRRSPRAWRLRCTNASPLHAEPATPSVQHLSGSPTAYSCAIVLTTSARAMHHLHTAGAPSLLVPQQTLAVPVDPCL